VGGARVGAWLRGKSWRTQLAVVVPLSILFTAEALVGPALFWILPVAFWPYVAYLVLKRPAGDAHESAENAAALRDRTSPRSRQQDVG